MCSYSQVAAPPLSQQKYKPKYSVGNYFVGDLFLFFWGEMFFGEIRRPEFSRTGLVPPQIRNHHFKNLNKSCVGSCPTKYLLGWFRPEKCRTADVPKTHPPSKKKNKQNVSPIKSFPTEYLGLYLLVFFLKSGWN